MSKSQRFFFLAVIAALAVGAIALRAQNSALEGARVEAGGAR